MEGFAAGVGVVEPEAAGAAPVDFDEDLLGFDQEIFLQAGDTAVFVEFFAPIAGSGSGGEDFDDKLRVVQGVGGGAIAIVAAHHQVGVAVGGVVDLEFGVGEVDAAVFDVGEQVAEEADREVVVGEGAAGHGDQDAVGEFVAVFLLGFPGEVFLGGEAGWVWGGEHGLKV